MHYTIASLTDMQFDQQLDLIKSGNRYEVGLYNLATKEYCHKEFGNLDDAYKLFEKLSHCICFGDYSYDDRKAMMN